MTKEGTVVQLPLTEKEKETVVKEFLPKIKSWVIRQKGMLPDSVDVDDLLSAACIGLIECIERYDKARGVSFATYAERRIKGSILDSLRNLDFLPRNVRTNIKALDAAINQLSSKLGRKPSIQEIVENTEFDEELVYKLLNLQENDKILSLDETVGDDDTNLVDFIKSADLSPEDELLKTKLTERLGMEVEKLSIKERQVVALYYFEELTMKEVAEVIGITESRVSQIHTQAIYKLKRRLKDLYE